MFSFLKIVCLHITYNSFIPHQFSFIYSFTFHFNYHNVKKTSPLYISAQAQYQIQFLNQSYIKMYPHVITIKVLSQVIFNPLNNNQKFSHILLNMITQIRSINHIKSRWTIKHIQCSRTSQSCKKDLSTDNHIFNSFILKFYLKVTN